MTAKSSPCGDCGAGNGERPPLAVLFAILAVVAGAVGATLVPPLVLGQYRGRPHRRGRAGLLRLRPSWYLAFTALAEGLNPARESALICIRARKHCTFWWSPPA